MSDVADSALEFSSWVSYCAMALWLGEDPFRDAEDLSRVLSDRLAAPIERRRLMREFEALTDSLAERLLGRELRLSRPDWVLMEDTLRRVAFRLAALRPPNTVLWQAQPDDLVRLRQVVRMNAPIGGALNSEAYTVLLAGCDAVVKALSLLPGDVEPFSGLLRKQGAFADSVAAVVDGTATLGSAVDRYRRFILEMTETIDPIFPEPADTRVRLDEIYVTRHVRRLSSPLSDDRLRPVSEALAVSRCVILCGEAGGGKTTLMRWLAAGMARGDLHAPISFNNKVPLLARLRKWDATTFKAPRLADLIEWPADQPEALDWSEDLLREGQAVLLLDGIDEVPKPQRAAVWSWVQDLALRYPAGRIVVTTRPSAIDGGSGPFDAYELAPMSETDIRRFAQLWFNAANPETRSSAANSSFTAMLLANAQASKLARNPLMCTLLCRTAVKHLPERLPATRTELYAVLIDELLACNLPSRPITTRRLGRSEQLAMLGQLAYWFDSQGLTEADRQHVVVALGRELGNLHNVRLEPQEALDALLASNAILREPVHGRIEFLHRTFQEYLAAGAVGEKQASEKVSGRPTSSGWTVVASGPQGESSRVVIAVDVARYSDRTPLYQRTVTKALAEMIQRSMEATGSDWGRCTYQSTGDGMLVILPHGTHVMPLVALLPQVLLSEIQAHNASRSAEAGIVLRLAISEGPVDDSQPEDLAGDVLRRVLRMLDARVLRGLPGMLAVIVERLPTTPRAALVGYQEQRVESKDLSLDAYVRVFGTSPVTSIAATALLPTPPNPTALSRPSAQSLRAAADERAVHVPLSALGPRERRVCPAEDILDLLRSPGPVLIPTTRSVLTRRTAVQLVRRFEAGGAGAVCVAYDDRNGHNQLRKLEQVSATVNLPVIADAPMVTRYQIREAWASGADLVMLTAADVLDHELPELIRYVEECGLSAVVRVGSAPEADRAREAGARAVCIGLKAGKVIDPRNSTFGELAPEFPLTTLLIAEIALSHRHKLNLASFADVRADAVLVSGEPFNGPQASETVREIVATGKRRWHRAGDGAY